MPLICAGTSPMPHLGGQLARSALMLILRRTANRLSLEVDKRRMKIASAESDGIGPDVTVPLPGKNIDKSFHTLAPIFVVLNPAQPVVAATGP